MKGREEFRQQFTRPVLMLVTEPMPRIARIVANAVLGGVDIVQWRDHISRREELLEMAGSMRAAVPSPTLLIVNGNPELAVASRANGVHLGEHGPPIADIRTDFEEYAIIGRSVHSIGAALVATAEGADYLIAGTIFASRSHPGLEPAGLDFLRKVCESVEIPVIAIGGVIINNARDCIDAGAAGVAVLSPIMHASDPKSMATAYKKAIRESA